MWIFKRSADDQLSMEDATQDNIIDVLDSLDDDEVLEYVEEDGSIATITAGEFKASMDA